MGRTHGKASTYNNGRCRCADCKAAIAQYRADRRSQGLDLPRRDQTEAQQEASA